MAIQVTPIVQKAIEARYNLQFDYTHVNTVMIILKQLNCSILEQEMQLFCRFVIGVPVNRQDEFLYRLKEIKQIEATPV